MQFIPKFRYPLIGLWVLLTALSFWLYPRYELVLSLEMHQSTEQVPSVYHSIHTRGFSADHHRYFSGGVASGDGYRRYETVLRTRQPIRMLRLDPMIKPGPVRIRSFELTGAQKDSWSMAQLQQRIESVQQLPPPVLSDSGAELALVSQGEDPYFTLKLNPQVYGDRTTEKAGVVLVVFALLWALLLWCAVRVRRWHEANPWLLALVMGRLRRFGSVFSDPGLIVFTPGVVVVVSGLCLTFLVGVSLKLNFSSLEVWNNHYKLESREPSLSWGEAKVIRSDEWYVHSPWVFSQAQRGLPVDNSNIGPPGAALLVAVPVKHISMIAQPKYWGFLFLDVDRAFAWFWMVKALGLLLFGFLLFLTLTRNDFVLSIAGAVGLYSSSYLQWWFSAFTPEVLTGFMASLVGAIYLFKGTRQRSVWAGALILPLSMVNLILHLYPAHIVPLAYLAVFLLVPLLGMAWARGVVQPLLKTRLWAGVLAMAVFCGLAYSVWLAAWPAVQAMMGTVYPGHRFSLGGGLGLEQVLMGFFEFWRDAYAYPNNGVNQSETARFIYLFPVGLLALVFYQHDKRLAALILAGTLYAVFCMFWMSWYMPEPLRLALAKLGWSLVPSNRLYMGLGVASLLVLVLTCQLMSKAGPAGRWRQVLAWTVAPVLLTLSWWYLRGFDPAFYNVQRLVAGVLIVGGMVAAVVLGRRTWLLALLLVAGWHNLQVNPILSGTDVLLNKTVFTSGAHLAGEGNSKWAVFGDLKVAQGLRAQGQDVLNGVQYAPNHAVMKLFDPLGQNQQAWNRYANMGLTLSNDVRSAGFELRAQDLFLINIHPCHPAFEQAGVTRFAFANVGDPGTFDCLNSVQAFPSVDVFYYERVR